MQATLAEVKKKIFKPEYAVLGMLIIAFTAANLVWLHMETAPVSWDQSAHLNISLTYYRIFKSFHLFTSNYAHLPNRLLDVTHFYPPFFHLTTVPLTSVFGFSARTVCATHLLYMALLVLCIYAIGKYFLNAWVGVGAAALILVFPISFGLSRTALIDFPLMAMVTFVQYLLLKSRGGTALKWSWLLGLTAGFCFLTKWTGPVFFIGTFLFVLITSMKAPKASKGSMLLALAICLAVGLGVALPWFIRSFQELIRMNRYLNLVDAVRRGLPKPFTLSSFIIYLNAIKYALTSNILFPFIVIGVAGFFFWSKKWKLLSFLGCWILPAYLFLVGLRNKDARFIVPILPALALLIAAGLSALPWKSFRKAAWLALFVVGLLQFCMVSFGWPKKMECPYARPPLKEDWSINAILDNLEKEFNHTPIVVGFLPDQPYFNAGTLRFYANLRQLPYDIRALGDTPITSGLISDCDVFIIKKPKLAVPWTAAYRTRFAKEFKQKGSQFFGFRRERQYRLPDRTRAFIFISLKHSGRARGT